MDTAKIVYHSDASDREIHRQVEIEDCGLGYLRLWEGANLYATIGPTEQERFFAGARLSYMSGSIRLIEH